MAIGRSSQPSAACDLRLERFCRSISRGCFASDAPQMTLPIDDSLARGAVRRINRRVMPFLLILYVIAFLDRVNVGYAGLQMTRELHFSNEVFGFGAGIFFVGYVLLEIP